MAAGVKKESGVMQSVDLAIASWNRYLTRDLTIEPELVGLMHEFSFDKYTVRIKLPSKKHFPTEPNQGELLTFHVWREMKGKKLPRELWVHAVDVIVVIPEQVSVPSEILNHPPNAYKIVPEPKQEQLSKLTELYSAISEKAFDLWIRTLRWKCDNSAIGRPEVVGNESGWSTYLITEPAGQRIWISGHVIHSRGSKAITPMIWKDAESALLRGDTPPVHVELMFDAIEHMKLGDLQRATVDMAVACESFLRMLVANNLPSSLNNSIKKYIDDANIRTVLTKFIPEVLTTEAGKQLKMIENNLHRLFDTRNDVVHTGRVSQLNSDDVGKFLEVTKKLFTLSEFRSNSANSGGTILNSRKQK